MPNSNTPEHNEATELTDDMIKELINYYRAQIFGYMRKNHNKMYWNTYKIQKENDYEGFKKYAQENKELCIKLYNELIKQNTENKE